VIENFPEGNVEEMEAINNPEDPSAGTRKVPFGRELFIEEDDFREDPPKKFHRLSPGAEVRLRAAYIIKCTGIVKDEKTGAIKEVRCTYDPQTRSGMPNAERKVKGTVHWVSAQHAVPAEVRLYDHLFSQPDPSDVPAGVDYKTTMNSKSLEVVQGMLEPSLANAKPGDRYQFERNGYFCVDTRDSRPGKLVFNRTVTLRDTWAKIEKKG
jgi:glutaminyl-tRNA synthetase